MLSTYKVLTWSIYVCMTFLKAVSDYFSTQLSKAVHQTKAFPAAESTDAGRV